MIDSSMLACSRVIWRRSKRSAISALRACLRLNRSRFETDSQPQCRFSAAVWHCAHCTGLLCICPQALTAALYLFSRSGSVASIKAPQPTRQSEINIAEQRILAPAAPQIDGCRPNAMMRGLPCPLHRGISRCVRFSPLPRPWLRSGVTTST
jgi:hypothetical protein